MMVLSGVPVGEAVRHFCDAEEEDDRLAGYAERWPVQDEVWHELTDSTRLDVSLKKHYNEMAYFLWSTNYVELEGSAKVKADTCRAAIEAKVAGMAGKESPLAAFYHNLLQRYEEQGKPVN